MSRHTEKIISIFFKKGYDEKYKENIINQLKACINVDTIAFYNPECIGVMNSTKDLFKNTVALKEIFSDKLSNEIADAIIATGVKQVIFSSITFGWMNLIENIYLKKSDIKIKFLWHGSHAMLVQKNEAYFLYNIMELLDRNIIHSIGFSKESMAEFYKLKGYYAYFVPNTVSNLKTTNTPFNKKTDKKYIGLYSAGNRWEKNTFNQLSAISMLRGSVIDIIPVTELVSDFCNLMNIEINDRNIGYLKRQDLLNRMAQNDLNLYVTFTECSPVVPLESLELGVPCITGNNHHYFRNSKLYDYLVVKSEDNIDEIYSKARIAIENKDEIIKLYKSWKKDYDVFFNQKLLEFLQG